MRRLRIFAVTLCGAIVGVGSAPASAGTPAPVIERHDAEMEKVLEGRAALAKFRDGEVERWSKVIRDNGIRAGE
jgi:hypothetical protein